LGRGGLGKGGVGWMGGKGRMVRMGNRVGKVKKEFRKIFSLFFIEKKYFPPIGGK